MERKLLFTASSRVHITNFHLPYLRALAEDGWTVDVACADPGETVPGARRMIALPLKKQIRAPQNFAAAAQLRRLIRAEGYELVVTHTSLAAFFTRLALKGLPRRPKLVNMVHGYLFDDETNAAKRRLLLDAERLTAPETDLLLTMNAYDEALARRWKLGARIERIPGVGVDFSRLAAAPGAGSELRERLGVPEDAFVLLYAAEFSARKSQAVLIRALSELPERAVLALPGSGALLRSCEALAEELGLSGRVLFPGQVAGIGAWYAMADAAVTASRSEGLPFNVMEAMAARRPVVASAVKGHADLIRDGENGFLYPYGDASACAKKIARLMEERALAERFADRAARDAEAYSLERVFPLVMEQYRSLVPVPAGLTKEDNSPIIN